MKKRDPSVEILCNECQAVFKVLNVSDTTDPTHCAFCSSRNIEITETTFEDDYEEIEDVWEVDEDSYEE